MIKELVQRGKVTFGVGLLNGGIGWNILHGQSVDITFGQSSPN